jgi:predicted nuclease of predicted toxin-antitoxin system
VKLLFDENLSSRLVHSLAAIYPGSEHVQDRQLDTADDAQIWDFAQANGFTIVSTRFRFL